MAITWQMRAAFGLCLAVLLAATSCPVNAAVVAPGYYPTINATSKDQSVYIGSVTAFDRLLLQETAYKEGSWWLPVVRDADIVYPKKNEIGYKISCIKILDQRRDGLNGEVKVKEGGIGTNAVLLRFHSQRGQTLNYVVQIFGH